MCVCVCVCVCVCLSDLTQWTRSRNHEKGCDYKVMKKPIEQ